MRKTTRFKALAIVLGMSICVVILSLLFLYDNKYSPLQKQPSNGVISISQHDLQRNAISFLATGWEFYPDVLLTPQEIEKEQGNLYRRYITLGTTNGIIGNGSFGTASYRLTLFLPDILQQYTLEIPEIYSASKVYINDKLYLSLGNTSNNSYSQAVQNTAISFFAQGKTQILINASDYSSAYGGMTYPPSIGMSQSVLQMREWRVMVHSLFAVLALICVALSLSYSIKLKRLRELWFALCCLFFAGMSAYPLVHSLFITSYQPWFTIEILCFYGVMLLAVLVQCSIYNVSTKKTILAIMPCVIIFIFAGIYSGLGLSQFNGLPFVFNLMSELSKYYTIAFLIISSFLALRRKQSYSFILLLSQIIFAVCILYDRLFALYEPIIGGSFVEIGAFVLVAVFAAVLWQDMIAAFTFKLVYEAEHDLLLNQLQANSTQVLQQHAYVRAAGKQLHEWKTSLSLLRLYAQKGEYEKQATYIDQLLEIKSSLEAPEYTQNSIIDAILYQKITEAKELNVYLEHDCQILPAQLPIADNALASVLINILNNALEGSMFAAEHWVYISILLSDNILQITCKNSSTASATPLKGNYWRHGHGIEIMREITREYGGTCKIDSFGDAFEVSVTLEIY